MPNWHLYPKPVGDLIIEPFAGGAMYSLRYCDRDVLLNEINLKIAALWRWLTTASLDEMSSEEKGVSPGSGRRHHPAGVSAAEFAATAPTRPAFLAPVHPPPQPAPVPGPVTGDAKRSPATSVLSHLPETVQAGQRVSETTDHPDAAALLECECNPGTGGSSHHDVFTERGAAAYYRVRPRIAHWHPRIRHWRVREGTYATLKNPTATWFIDPPYQGKSGQGYMCPPVDFVYLSEWTSARSGWVIQQGADWLPFRPFRDVVVLAGNGPYKIREGVWTSRWPMVANGW